jgi:hypothetical protein
MVYRLDLFLALTVITAVPGALAESVPARSTANTPGAEDAKDTFALTAPAGEYEPVIPFDAPTAKTAGTPEARTRLTFKRAFADLFDTTVTFTFATAPPTRSRTTALPALRAVTFPDADTRATFDLDDDHDTAAP